MTEPEREYLDALLHPEVIAARKQLGLASARDIEAGAPLTAAERAMVEAFLLAAESYLTALREEILRFGTALSTALGPILADARASSAAMASAFARMGKWQDNYGRETGPGRERA